MQTSQALKKSLTQCFIKALFNCEYIYPKIKKNIYDMEAKNMKTANVAIGSMKRTNKLFLNRRKSRKVSTMRTVQNATISMGKPITAPVLIPVEHKSTPTCINNPFMVDGRCYKVTALSFGSPHGAVVVDDVDSLDVSTLGAKLGTHVLFPKGASIVFIQMIDRESLKVRLWQHGEGEIAFTPEAVCVAATAAMMLQKVLGNNANVSMGGNLFQVNWKRGGEVSLTGDTGGFVQAA